LGSYLDISALLAITAAVLSLCFLLFLIPSKNFSTNAVFLCVIYLVIIAPYLFSNLIISLALYSIFSVFVTYFNIINNDKKLSTAHLTTDFIWHRASDLGAFISLFLILLNNKNIFASIPARESSSFSSIYALVFFAAMVLRLITLPANNYYLKYNSESGFNYAVLGRISISIGALLFLHKTSSLIFDLINPNETYLIIIFILFIHNILTIIKHDELIYLPINFAYTVCIFSLGAMAFGNSQLALILILTLIMTTPCLILITSQLKSASKKTNDPIALLSRFTHNLAQFGARAAARFASIFYANFLFYRLPQLIISLFQIPLRIFHTGSIQRSLLFIMVLMASYYWLWR
jgi:hypothetical protein